jgi:hypothetical protein
MITSLAFDLTSWTGATLFPAWGTTCTPGLRCPGSEPPHQEEDLHLLPRESEKGMESGLALVNCKSPCVIEFLHVMWQLAVLATGRLGPPGPGGRYSRRERGTIWICGGVNMIEGIYGTGGGKGLGGLLAIEKMGLEDIAGCWTRLWRPGVVYPPPPAELYKAVRCDHSATMLIGLYYPHSPLP